VSHVVWKHQKQLYELSHADKWKDHKYVARIPTGNANGNKYRYFYSKEEYQAYLNGKKADNTKNTKKTKATETKKTTKKKTKDTETKKTTKKKTKDTETKKTTNTNTKNTAKATKKETVSKKKEVVSTKKEPDFDKIGFDRFIQIEFGPKCTAKILDDNDDGTIRIQVYENGKPKVSSTRNKDSYKSQVESAKIDHEYGIKWPSAFDYDDSDDYDDAMKDYKKKHAIALNDIQRKKDEKTGREPNRGMYDNEADDGEAFNKAYSLWRNKMVGKTDDTDPYQRVSTDRYGEFVKAINDGYDPFKDIAKLNKKESIEDAMYRVNPNYNPYDKNEGYEINCAYCSIAYEMRRRGYDVESVANTEWQADTDVVVKNTTYNMLYKWFKKPSVFTKVYKEDIAAVPAAAKNQAGLVREWTKELESFGDGARGIITVRLRGTDSGHAVAWEIDKGKLRVIDAQVAQEYQLSEFVARASTISYIRTDNLEVSPYLTYMMKTKKKKGASK
jgi:hypothetical protein